MLKTVAANGVQFWQIAKAVQVKQKFCQAGNGALLDRSAG